MNYSNKQVKINDGKFLLIEHGYDDKVNEVNIIL